MTFVQTAFILQLCSCVAASVTLGNSGEFFGSLVTNFITAIHKSPPEIAMFTNAKMATTSFRLQQPPFSAFGFANGTSDELRTLLERDVGSHTRPMIVIIDVKGAEELNCFLEEVMFCSQFTICVFPLNSSRAMQMNCRFLPSTDVILPILLSLHL